MKNDIVRFMHAADIHLDSALHGLERYQGAPVEQIRSATRSAFDKRSLETGSYHKLQFFKQMPIFYSRNRTHKQLYQSDFFLLNLLS